MRAAYPKRILRAESVKAAVPPADFYKAELPATPTPKRSNGWADGGLCPFHADKHPGSFKINLDTGAFRCFSCGAKGSDVISFTQRRHGMSFPDAIKAIAAAWGVRP